jgi:hypothetical protein
MDAAGNCRVLKVERMKLTVFAAFMCLFNQPGASPARLVLFYVK